MAVLCVLPSCPSARFLPSFQLVSLTTLIFPDLAVAAFAVLTWSLFLLHVTNAERLSSSVLRQVTYQLRNSEDVKRAIGGGVRYAENWWGESLFLAFLGFGV